MSYPYILRSVSQTLLEVKYAISGNASDATRSGRYGKQSQCLVLSLSGDDRNARSLYIDK